MRVSDSPPSSLSPLVVGLVDRAACFFVGPDTEAFEDPKDDLNALIKVAGVPCGDHQHEATEWDDGDVDGPWRGLEVSSTGTLVVLVTTMCR